MRKLLIAILVVIAVGACSSSGSHRPEKVTQIYVRQLGYIFFGGGQVAPVTLEVDVTNLSEEPLKLRRVTVDSPGMATYALDTISRTFNESIEPRERHTVRLFGNARTRSRNIRTIEPLGVRVVAEFEGSEGRFMEIHLMQAQMGAESAIR